MIRLGGILGRYVLVWLVYVLALLLVAGMMPGVRLELADPQWWIALFLLPVEFAVLVIVLRPLLLFLTLPLNVVTLGLPTLVFNGVLLYLAAQGQRGVVIADFTHALLASLTMTVIATPVVSLLGLDEAYPFYQRLLYRFGRRWWSEQSPTARAGLLILQIDGLSHGALLEALQLGRLPTLSALLARGTHRVFRWSCGLPSNTPAMQAGFFYGNRFDVPGYRWFDRRAQTLRVVSRPDDARLLEDAAATASRGLLADGSAINTLLSGGARKRLLTITALGAAASDARRGERADLNLFLLSPTAYTHAVLASLWDGAAGFAVGLAGMVRRGRPRLRRLPERMAQGAAVNAFLRSVSFHLIKQDIARGVPIIYSNYVAYDDVAHVTAPTSAAALSALAAFDRSLRKLRRFARHGAPMPYELLVLSDHGQSASVPFRLLYGSTFGKVLADLAGQTVSEEAAASPEAFYLGNLLTQLESGTRPSRWTARRGRGVEASLGRRQLLDAPARRRLAALEPADREAGAAAPGPPPELVVCVSGCLAHVYAKGRAEPLVLEEVMALYPGLVASLAAHPGVGFVAALREFGDAVAIGRDGVRNLITGQVVGRQDPLGPYGDTAWLAQELAQLLAYPSSGDLMVNGAWLADRQEVVVLEEQLSSHGGIGGAQTEPFAILPATWRTRSEDLASPEALHRHVARQRARILAVSAGK